MHFNTSYVSVLHPPPEFSCTPIQISIHRMFRFYCYVHESRPMAGWISIHRMFRFYQGSILKKTSWNSISIHRMFRFYVEYLITQSLRPVFQYIVCFGSTLDKNGKSVYKYLFQYIVCFGSTLKNFSGLGRFFWFQYIVCFGSTVIFQN